MIILNSKLERIEEQEVEEFVHTKLVAMGYKETDTVQVNL